MECRLPLIVAFLKEAKDARRICMEGRSELIVRFVKDARDIETFRVVPVWVSFGDDVGDKAEERWVRERQNEWRKAAPTCMINLPRTFQ